MRLEKGVWHTKTVWARKGNTRAPYGKAKKEQLKKENTMRSGTIGALIGGCIDGPLGTPKVKALTELHEGLSEVEELGCSAHW